MARSFDGGYERKLRNEQEHFRDQSNVHDLPPIFHYWAHTYVRPMAAEYGFANAEELYVKYLALSAQAAPGEAAVFLSLGAGNCDAEVRVARTLRDGGLSDFVIECLDLNPVMLERGRTLAEEAGVADHLAFLEGDFNKWTARRPYTAVIANQALHHILELEHVYDEVNKCLLPHGYFVTSDMIGRNGHLRWPEALREVQRFWRELPIEYRWNRALERYEEEYVDHDCSTDGFEGVRAQDVLPLLIERFDFPLFVAFGNVINMFVDRNFGFHFDDNAAWDRGFIDRVHAFDEQAILSGALTPTQMFAVMTSKPCAEHHYARGLSPRQSVRRESHAPAPLTGVAIAVTSLRPAEEGSVEYRQQLAASGGQGPYE
ncbi:MAG: methyltransferase domain-containing protein [Acidobacteria bacterium]|nr:methyltransferase domain-containing protein [Acidobacteriota bacterium]